MKLFTIVFTKNFFELLIKNDIKELIDIRLNNDSSELTSLSKGADLEYFLKVICGIRYCHIINLAPTKEILDDYKNKKITWAQYEKKLIDLLDYRNISGDLLNFLEKKSGGICLLCSNSTPGNHHRRLIGEYINNKFPDFEIKINNL